MIIEFAGLPGAGKTTVAKDLQQHGFEFIRGGKISIKRIVYALYFSIVFPKSFVYFIWYTIKQAQSYAWLKYTLVNIVFHVQANYVQARLMDKVIIDQGHWHALLALFINEQSQDKLQRIAKTLPRPDVLILFKADAQVRHDRLVQRGYGVREEFNEELVRRWQSTMEQHSEYLADIAKSLKVRVCVIDANKSIAEVSQDVRNCLDYENIA